MITRDSTGKAKRLSNNHDVRIVSCSFKGEPKDEWIKAKAENITGDEADKAIKLRKKKIWYVCQIDWSIYITKGQSYRLLYQTN